MIDGTAIDHIADLAKDATKPHITEHGGQRFSDRSLTRVVANVTLPVTLNVSTLASLATLMTQDARAKLVHILGPQVVTVLTDPLGEDQAHRGTLACATATPNGTGFAFNEYGTLEGLNIALQTRFLQDAGSIAELQRFCASVRATESIGVDDDGVAQSVAAKSGIAAVVRRGVKNPWKLAPYRTFPEVMQPVSTYVLRFQKDDDETGLPLAGLFETGDNAWLLEAKQHIHRHLVETLGVTLPILA